MGDGAGLLQTFTEECSATLAGSADYQSDFDPLLLDEYFGEGFVERATVGELDIVSHKDARVRLYYSIVDRNDPTNVYLHLPDRSEWGIVVGTNMIGSDPISAETGEFILGGESNLGMPWQWEDGSWRLAECPPPDDPSGDS